MVAYLGDNLNDFPGDTVQAAQRCGKYRRPPQESRIELRICGELAGSCSPIQFTAAGIRYCPRPSRNAWTFSSAPATRNSSRRSEELAPLARQGQGSLGARHHALTPCKRARSSHVFGAGETPAPQSRQPQTGFESTPLPRALTCEWYSPQLLASFKGAAHAAPSRMRMSDSPLGRGKGRQALGWVIARGQRNPPRRSAPPLRRRGFSGEFFILPGRRHV